MVVDYSSMINRFTELDAYPMLNIAKMVEDIAKYNVFSTLDLQSAYHQISISLEDRKYTAFEVCGKLYQFTRLPFGFTNRASAFQRSIDNIVDKEKLSDTFVFVDNVTICGKTQKEHDYNLQRFFDVVKMRIKVLFQLIRLHFLDILFITTRSHQTIIEHPYSKCHLLKILNHKNEESECFLITANSFKISLTKYCYWTTTISFLWYRQYYILLRYWKTIWKTLSL